MRQEIIQYPLAAGGTLTRVLECGCGDDVAIFIHGLGARADRWRVTLPAFAEAGFRCLAFDLPGHGFAAKGAAAPASVPAFARVLAALLDQLGLGRVFLVGTSLGGHVAATFACSRPDRVRGLVLVGAVGLVPLGPEAGDAIRRNVRDTRREAIAGKFAFVLADPGQVTPALVEEEWRINNSPGADESFAVLGDYIAGGIDRDNVSARLAGLIDRIPTLLVWGAADKAVPVAIGRQAQALLAGPPLVLVERAGHAPYMEQPAAFNAEVIPFLDRCRGRSG